MRFAYPSQKFQDWVTQQWVIFRGKKIDPDKYQWLFGPFGNLDAIGKDYIYQLAEKENLIISEDSDACGLITSMNSLNMPADQFCRLSEKVADFYEHTQNFNLNFSVQWNPFFRVFGLLISKLFSTRINQLNIPSSNL
ncbi:MAG: hypothetical protein EOO01_24285, partial [Chitinophagaceae bacterium]